MHTKSFFAVFFSAFVLTNLLTGCANIIPPSGGPRDSLPPVAISALPKDSALSFTGNKIQITFNEFIEAKEVQSNLLVSPWPQNLPQVDYKLKNLFIKLKDSLQPNTTYTLQFGNAIRDVNEGNIAKNFTYVFSTGSQIHTASIQGKVVLAQTGQIDSSLLVVLHSNLTDTAITKLRPQYIGRLNGKGQFNLQNLMPGTYRLYALPNDYSKRYDDSTKIFAFADSVIVVTDKTTVTASTIFAFQEAKKKENAPKQSKQPVEKTLKYNLATDTKHDFLKTNLDVQFNKPIKIKDSTAIQLCDTFYKPIAHQMQLDSTGKLISFTAIWQPGMYYKLVLGKTSITDTSANPLPKSDTLHFSVQPTNAYGSVKLRFKNLVQNAVLLIYESGQLKESYPIASNTFYKQYCKPGEYELFILKDDNKNGKWDTGNFTQKRQPEKVISLSQKLSVKANWDNEADYEVPALP